MGYDAWKMTEPYDPTTETPTCCACNAPCEGLLRDPNGSSRDVYCPQCVPERPDEAIA